MDKSLSALACVAGLCAMLTGCGGTEHSAGTAPQGGGSLAEASSSSVSTGSVSNPISSAPVSDIATATSRHTFDATTADRSGDPTTAGHTTGGLLERFMRQTTTLRTLDQIQFNVYVNATGTSALPDPDRRYVMSWDETSQAFLATGEIQCDQNGCRTVPLSGSASVAVDPSFWSSTGLSGWSASFGGGDLFIALNAPATALDQTTVVYQAQELVYPDDASLPAVLYCVSNCPTASSLAAYFTQSQGNPVPSPYGTSFNQWQPVNVPVKYGLSGNVLRGGDGSPDAAIFTVASAYRQYPPYRHGVVSGRMVASLADAQCGVDQNDQPQYCDSTMSSASMYYRWQTGPQSSTRQAAALVTAESARGW